jgi:hypothetical protein
MIFVQNKRMATHEALREDVMTLVRHVAAELRRARPDYFAREDEQGGAEDQRGRDGGDVRDLQHPPNSACARDHLLRPN